MPSPFSVATPLAHGHVHAVLPRALHITQFRGSSRGNLHWYVVILAKPTAHAESHNLLQTKCPQSGSSPHATPTAQHPPADTLRRANPLWRNAANTMQLGVIVSWSGEQIHAHIYDFAYSRALVLPADSRKGNEEGREVGETAEDELGCTTGIQSGGSDTAADVSPSLNSPPPSISSLQ